MLDLIRITENPDELKNMLIKRGFANLEVVDKILEVQARKKSIQTEAESLRSERNRVSKEIGMKKSKGEDISAASESMKIVGDKIKALEEKLELEETSLQDLNHSLPNFLDDEVPTGKSEEDNVELYKVGERPKFDFQPKTHFEIGEALKIFDFERGVKLSGARAYTYFGLAAKLERALMNFMLDVHSTEHGYSEVWVPQVVNDESMFTTGQYPKFKDEYYRMERDSLNLIPTAEVPLTNLYRDEILSEENLPICVTAHTSCFRREAGSYGRDTRGLVRVHQFQKVELVKFCKPEDSEAEHKKMLSDAENILKLLGLHYRV
ncbi:MAG: serine--tRNA ligase, partial [Leptospiraceae bacterium]|nr:serine--tRNA ligase [Leptospiraceae bacterium]